MSLVLRADNRSLIKEGKSSFLADNYAAGVTSLVLKNGNGFSPNIGDSTTQFDITNTTGTTYRYTWDGTGTTPGTLQNLISVGGSIIVAAQNFTAANNGTFTITAVAATYFEVTNAAGVVESNKTIGTGSIKIYLYALLGNFGSETTEVVTISALTTNTLTVSTTLFAHAESTKVTIIPYNQIRFYHTTTATYATTDPITGYINIQPDSNFSVYSDTNNSTGFGWFVFYNSTSGKTSANCNAIPYAGFDDNSAKKILDSFFSLLNNKEQKAITNEEAFYWLNEGLTITQNALNIVNQEYTVAEPYTLSVTVALGAEYDWPSYFSSISSVSDLDGKNLDHIDIHDIKKNNANSGNSIMYYLRGRKIGFSPVPTVAATYYLYYRTLPTKVTSLYDSIYMPNNNFYLLINFMLYKAGLKLGRADAANQYKLFSDGLDVMRVTSNKQNDDAEEFEIEHRANI